MDHTESPKKSTKQRILDTAVKCFNQEGFGNVSLQDLARETGMSRGNLAYHYANKDLLLTAISRQMWDKIHAERIKSRTFPSFQNLQKEVKLYHRYQREYAFIFSDSNVLKQPVIKKQMQEMTKITIQDNKAAIAFAIRVGNLQPEPYPGLYDYLAFNTWMLMFFWQFQQKIRNVRDGLTAEKAIWGMMIPYFTPKGIEAFKGFYGDHFLEDLGAPFQFNIDDIMAF